ncbi:Crp/Fnr family transcriptional regulator [Nonomuraea sp. NPDC050663]|uniref:Crp/Fnr family transcriptional regulator n=1 Tax=Nonomuraea sp. NPDC050663 TaxID=3364370 RepID=UPI0037A99147
MTSLPPSGFLGHLAPPDRRALLGEGAEASFPPRATLCFQGEPGTSVMLILSGAAKAGRTLADGTPTVMGLCGPGDIVGEISAVAGEDSPRLATVTAVSDVTCRVLAASCFRRVLDARPRIYQALVAVAHDRLRRSADKEALQAAHSVKCRTARMLRELAVRHGREQPQGVLIALSLTQLDLALLIGASRESVVRALAGLRVGGIITTRRRQIVIRDLGGLTRASECR